MQRISSGSIYWQVACPLGHRWYTESIFAIIGLPFQRPDRDEWGSGLEAMKMALSLEKSVNQCLTDLRRLAESKGDVQVCVHGSVIGGSIFLVHS